MSVIELIELTATYPAISPVAYPSGAVRRGPTRPALDGVDVSVPAGGFGVMPIGTRHFAWTTEESVIQIHGIGPWGITYVNPADDPRNGG